MSNTLNMIGMKLVKAKTDVIQIWIQKFINKKLFISREMNVILLKLNFIFKFNASWNKVKINLMKDSIFLELES